MSDTISINILYFLSEAFAIYCLHIFFKTFMPIKQFHIKKYVICLATILLYTLPNLIFHSSKINLFFGIISFLFYSYMFDAKIRYKIVITFFAVTLSLFSERMVILIGDALQIDFSLNAGLFGISGMIVSRLIFFVIIKVIYLAYRKKEKHILETYNWWAVLAIPVFTIIIVYQLYLWTAQFAVDNGVKSYVWILVMLFFGNGLVFYLYENLLVKYHETLRMETENTLYLNHIQTMSKNQKGLNNLKHDMKNYLAGIMTAIKSNNIDHAITLLHKKIGDLNATVTINSGNTSIDTLTSYIIQKAIDNGIFVYKAITVPEDINIDFGDLAVILGNSMDNAIEACNNFTNEKDKKIELELTSLNGKLIYRIKNKLTTIKLDNGIPISTKSNKNDHGFGLNSIKNIVKKNKGHIDIKTDNGYFEIQIIL